MTDALRKAHDRLRDAVAEIVSGEDWKQMLHVASKFHRYSLNNQLLILGQRPDATRVAGYRKWQDLGRQVRKGEKGIAILAPCKYRTKIEEESGEETTVQSIRGFRVAYVFDVSQTEGEPLPGVDTLRPKLLDGGAPEGIWDRLVQLASSEGFDVVRRRRNDENGYCDYAAREIGVRPDVAPAQAVKTLVHELGHALLHDNDELRNREAKEVEVESVAYVVCAAVGLDTGGYSFSYVAGWSGGDGDLVRASAERVIECSRRILCGLEGEGEAAAA